MLKIHSRYLAITAFSLFVIQAFSAEAEFKVGMILPLTGPVAEYGTAMQNSIEMARRDYPERFTNIRFLYEDAAYDAKQAVTAFQALKNTHRVDLIYTFGVSFCRALAPLAEASRTPLIGQCIDPHSSANRRYVLRFMNYTDEYSAVQARFIRDMGWKNIAILLGDNAYLEELYASLAQALGADVRLTLIERLPPGEMNLRTYITKIQHGAYDSVGVFLGTGQISSYFRQAREQGVQLPSFGTNWFETLSEVSSATGAMDGAFFANNEVSKDFIQRYTEQFKNENQLAFGALAYEFARLTGELFNSSSPSISDAEILNQFRSVGHRRGVATNTYKFVSSPVAGDYFQFPIIMKQISGSSFPPVAGR